MNHPTAIVLVGIGGYGNNYVSALLDSPDRASFSIVGAVDPSPEHCVRLAELKDRGVSIYPSLDTFYAARSADLAVISSPQHFHAPQTCLALSRGSHVLCEKPLTATPDEARQMAQAQKRAGKIVAIGYQWAFSKAIQELKSDILAGRLGKPIRLRTLALWPRTEVYYQRNNWAGLKQTADGTWVLDSPASNACAHFLFNMLYVLGDRIDSSARLRFVTAELYRAYPIQNYDTISMRGMTTNNVELLFVASHAIEKRTGPNLSYEFENGTVEFTDSPAAEITARFRDGSIKIYGSPNENKMRKLWNTVDGIRTKTDSICGIDAAAAHTHCVWAIQQSTPEIVDFAPHSIRAGTFDNEPLLIVDGLAEALTACCKQSKLPSELGFKWAKAGNVVSL